MAKSALFAWFNDKEHRLTMHLSGIFFLIIGTLWLFGSLQEPIFYHCVGQIYHPQVNVAAFLVMLPAIFGYMWLASSMSLAKLCITVAGLYGLLFSGATLVLMHPTLGLANAIASPDRLIGWSLYALIKVYGIVMVALFWSYVTSVSTVDAAKYRFPIVLACAQVGSFLSSTFVRSASGCGIPFLLWCGVAGIACITMWFSYLYATQESVHDENKAPSPGLLEGLLVIIQRPYLRSVLAVSVIYVMIVAFTDYHMHFLAHMEYPSINDLAWFRGVYGQIVNGSSFLMTLLATRRVIEFLGISGCLLLYPLLIATCVAVMWVYPSLWVVAGTLALIRALTFALHNPVKEIIYIPEDATVRVKAKGWIDAVGYSTAFTIGNYVTLFIQHPYGSFLQLSTIIAFTLIAVWWVHARRVASHFQRVA